MFLMTEYLIKKHPVPTKPAKTIFIKVQSCNELLCMLLPCLFAYIKLVLRYKFLILVTYHRNSLYLREQGCEDPWFFLRDP